MLCKPIRIPEQKEILGVPFPAVYSMEGAPDDDFWSWVSEHTDWFRDTMRMHGAILLRGAPIHNPVDFERFVDTAGFPRMPYVGGAAPRKEVTSRVLTSNESPPSEPIPFHHEMSQVPSPPSYIFFYCDVPPSEGGATAIAHSAHTYNLFQSVDPDFAHQIEEKGVKYIRVMPDQDDHRSAIGRSWRSTFQTNSKEEAEKKMSKAGMSWSWLDNGDVRTETAVLPAVRVEKRTKQKTFFNSMIAAYTGWIDERNDPKKAVVCGDGTLMNDDVLHKTDQLMKRDSVAIQWRKGDILCIDNHLVLHARHPFSGPRRILATISP